MSTIRLSPKERWPVDFWDYWASANRMGLTDREAFRAIRQDLRRCWCCRRWLPRREFYGLSSQHSLAGKCIHCRPGGGGDFGFDGAGI